MTLRGNLEHVFEHCVLGWAWETDRPEDPVSLIVTANNEIVGRGLAERYRADLEGASIGNGRHSFHLELDYPLSPLVSYEIQVRREGDGALVPGSPRRLDAARRFDLEMQDRVAKMLSVFVKDQDDLDRRMAFLIDQTNRLRQAHADNVTDKETHRRRRRFGWQEPSVAQAGEDVRDVILKPRALVLDDRMPMVGFDAGSNAILSHMHALQRLGFDVTFVPATLQGDGATLEAADITCCLDPWYTSVEDVLRRQADTFALVYLHRGSIAARYGALARHHQPKARIVYSVADLHFLRLSRQAEVEDRLDLKALSQRTRMSELSAAWSADAVITHSTAEASILARQMRPEKVHVVPWSVTPRPDETPFAQRYGLAFVGGYGHGPNVDAAYWLVDAIMPAVWALDPSITCILAGSEMPDSVERLEGDRVEIAGHVEHLSQIFGRVRLTVAPLAFGAGLKGKVLDSMAAGLPCVCTPSAAEGFNFTGVLAQQVGVTPGDLARIIVALHRDEILNRTCRDAGLAFVGEFASEAKVDAALAKAAGLRRKAVDPHDDRELRSSGTIVSGAS